MKRTLGFDAAVFVAARIEGRDPAKEEKSASRHSAFFSIADFMRGHSFTDQWTFKKTSGPQEASAILSILILIILIFLSRVGRARQSPARRSVASERRAED